MAEPDTKVTPTQPETKTLVPEVVIARHGENLAPLNQTLERYTKQGYHVIGPLVIQELPRDSTLVLNVVKINPDPKAKQVYNATPGSAEVSPAKPAYALLASAAGISWNWRASGRVDKGDDPNVCIYRAVGWMVNFNGQRREAIAEKEINLIAIQRELWANYDRKARDWPQKIREDGKTVERKLREEEIDEWVKERVIRDLVQMKKHMHARAQTGAMNRVTALLLGLKSSYDPKELEKPFIVPYLRYTPDMTDPRIKELEWGYQRGVLDQVYGQPPPLTEQAVLTHAIARQDLIDFATGSILDEEEEPEPPKRLGNGTVKKPAKEQTVAEGPGQPTSPPAAEGTGQAAGGQATQGRFELERETLTEPSKWEVAWNDAETDEQRRKVLREMMEAKGKRESDFTKPVAKFDAKQLEMLYNHLFGLPDKIQAK